MDAVTEISQLLLGERQARDRGWWDRMRAAYAPDSAVRLSWFPGTGPELVRAPGAEGAPRRYRRAPAQPAGDPPARRPGPGRDARRHRGPHHRGRHRRRRRVPGPTLLQYRTAGWALAARRARTA